MHAADPGVTETIKRTVQPYFVLDGNICALLAAKDHVNVFVYDGGIVPDPERIITAGHDNKTARTVGIRQGETINAAARPPCSARSSRITGPAAGAGSRPGTGEAQCTALMVWTAVRVRLWTRFMRRKGWRRTSPRTEWCASGRCWTR